MTSHRRLCCLVLSIIGSVAVACNIPVFRYALERWQSDTYEIVVFRGEEPNVVPEQADWLEYLEANSRANGGNINLNVRYEIDTRPADSQIQVRSTAGERPVTHWSGSVQEAMKLRLVDSPVRQELTKRLLSGDSVVWLLLRTGDTEKADAAKGMLKQAFKTLESKIEMPDGIGLPGSELHSETPLLIKFSLIEINPNDEDEAFLIQSLTGFHGESNDGKQEDPTEPLAVPVFGRGRALEVIPASELTPQLVEDLTLFLSGACSCQVKEQNPGFDLLLSVDWDSKLFGVDGLRPPPAKNASDEKRPTELLPIPPGKRK